MKGDDQLVCHEHLDTISQGRKFWRKFSLGGKRECTQLVKWACCSVKSGLEK